MKKYFKGTGILLLLFLAILFLSIADLISNLSSVFISKSNNEDKVSLKNKGQINFESSLGSHPHNNLGSTQDLPSENGFRIFTTTSVAGTAISNSVSFLVAEQDLVPIISRKEFSNQNSHYLELPSIEKENNKKG